MKDYGFELLTTCNIDEQNTTAKLFRHIRTGAQLLSLENSDENKVFGITFRTPPKDSTGVAHIMEHSVLCGSQKYPLKEPFIELMKGSLNTFLNAFTYPDKTCYPIASQNLKDFYNLIDVYIDAVFHPLIPVHILEQEGWHYELEDLDAPLTYKGVVFNEMKGAYSDPDNVLYRSAMQSLFPDNPYGVDSGGNPNVIPNLTYKQFSDFHSTYYHPSNAYIFFYGDDDPQERLRRVNDYLEGFGARDVNSSIELQPRFEKPKRVEIPFDPGEEASSKKGMLVVNWLLADDAEAQTILALSILAHILVGTPASPLRKALIDSGWGEDLAGAELDSEIRQAYFSTGLKGMAVNEAGELVDGENVEQLINDTLQTLAQNGIDPDTVTASLNTVEFLLRENNTGSYPRGLLLMLRSLTSWLYDRDPILPLAFETPLAAIKERVSAGETYFENMIRDLFLDNQHKTTVIMKPVPGINQEIDQMERKRLEKARAEMSRDELQAIIENNQKLRKIQETPDSPATLATIPTLYLEDLEKENKFIPIDVLKHKACTVLYHNMFTNAIAYLDIGFNLHVITQDLLPYIPLFGRALTEMGTEDQDFVQLSQRIGCTTGGIHAAKLISSVTAQKTSVAWLFLRGKATMENADELLAITSDVLRGVNLDNKERFLQMVLEEKATVEAQLVPSGHRVVNTRLRSQFSESGWADEVTGGVSYLFFLRKLIKEIELEWHKILDKLETIRKTLVNRQIMLVNVTLDETNWRTLLPLLENFLEEIPIEPVTMKSWAIEKSPNFQGLSIPAHVNFVGKGADLFSLGYQLNGSISVISNYLRTTWLWERIRIQGGAYGGFCLFNRHSSVFTFLSYRDPNLLTTLENYDGTAHFLRQSKLSQDELTKSIIGTIGKLDAYLLPDAKGYSSMVRYLIGDTEVIRQQWRNQILNTKAEDFRAFGEILEQVNQNGQIVIMGAEEAIQAANRQEDGKFHIIKIL